MKIIQNNPYRTVGLLVGASAREQNRQINRLKQFIEAEQNPQDDFSFPTLGQLHRTIDRVAEAASRLNLDKDKINAALFWFYNGNSITDEPAFDALKGGLEKEAATIWGKLIQNKDINLKNASAFFNWATLFLNAAFYNSQLNIDHLERGVKLKLIFLESDFINDFKSRATDETFKTTKKELQILFLQQLQFEIGKNDHVSRNKFIDILSKEQFSAKEDFLKDFAQHPIEQIEKKIEEAKSKRRVNKANAFSIGKVLYDQTTENLKQLKLILGPSNLKFSSISDKISDEILQCGIDYFLYFKDSSYDPSSATMDLFQKAKILAIGNISKQRCQENTENLKEWVEEKPERERQEKILIDLDRLKQIIDEYKNRSNTIVNGKQLLLSTKPYLNNIKNVLGGFDELYLGLSSRIASDAQGMCIEEINKLQERLNIAYDSATKLSIIVQLKQKVNDAWEVSNTIGAMDLVSNFKTNYNNNRVSLQSLKNQLANLNTTPRTPTYAPTYSTGSKTTNSGGGGCYIATMAYGNYDHPQVMILRQFRDNVLDKSCFGKWFIKTYYHCSPKLVEKLKNKKGINAIIRKALNQFIKLIK